MPLVNNVQIPQNYGMNTQPQYSATVSQDLFKMAGAEAALMDLGLLPSGDMEKDAIWGQVAKAAIPWLWRGAKTLGSKLWGAGGKAVGTVAKPLGGLGHRAVQGVGGRLGASPATIAKAQGLGKGMAREAVGFGALSGGLGALTAEPGQRGGAFLRGAAGGALGGLAWRGTGNLTTAGMRQGLGKRFAGIEAASKGPILKRGGGGLGQRAKSLGAKALTGGVPFAAGIGASMMMPTFEGGHGGPRTQAQRFAPHVARLAGGSTMGAYPQHPMGYAYNPNLPMPQYGY